MIPDDFKQQLLNRVDIVDVIERHVQLRKAGQNYVARCPFHNEKTPSFSVSPSKQFYHCFGCGAHGNAIGFVMEHAGLGYVEAVRELAAMVGMTLPEQRAADLALHSRHGPDLPQVLLQAARFYKDQLRHSERAIGYLKQRGVSGEIAARFGLGYAPVGWQSLAEAFSDYKTSAALKDAGLVIDAEGGRRYDRFRDRIVFPIASARGTIIGFGGRIIDAGEPKYLNSPETALFEKGRELYGLFQARQGLREHGRAVVVEGYMDVVALAQHSVAGVVATLGTATTPTHVEKLLRLTDEVIFCFDGDEAGRRAAWRAVEMSLAKLADGKRIAFLFLPDGDDPDSYVRREGGHAFDAQLRGAIPLSEMVVRELSERSDLASPEGRARLLHLAKPLLAQVSAPALSLLLRRRLATVAQVDIADIERLFGLRRAAQSALGATSAHPRRSAPTLMRWLLQAIMIAPQLAVRLERSLLDPTDRYTPALGAVLDLLAARPDITPRQVVPWAMEYLQDGAITSVLREIQSDLMSAPQVDIEPEFSQAVAKAQQQSVQRRLTALRASEYRTPEEQAEFERLLRGLSRAASEARLPATPLPSGV
ncbi:MAG: DNA primase [Burkholderiales bacterium]|nr:DNA primase [Burkholderiales bacterium]